MVNKWIKHTVKSLIVNKILEINMNTQCGFHMDFKLDMM